METEASNIGSAVLAVSGLWVLGFILHRSAVPNGYIPNILLIIGAPVYMQVFNADWSNIVHWLGALALAGSATGMNEAIQKTKELFTKPRD